MRSLLTLSVFLALIRENKGLNLTVLPRFPEVYVGDDVTLKCGKTGQTTWFINNTEQSHTDALLLLTTVTTENNGVYECQQGGQKSNSQNLTVLAMEPYAQLSPSVGGAVMNKGGGRNLVLQVDDGLKNWRCFGLRKDIGFFIDFSAEEQKKNWTLVFAEFDKAERVTYWCRKKNTTLRSNAVTLRMTEGLVMLDLPVVPALQGEPVALRCAVWGGGAVEKATFFRNGQIIHESRNEKYTIPSATDQSSGNYSCLAIFRYSHIDKNAAQREVKSDPQEIKVIEGGPPVAKLSLVSDNTLQCSCQNCPSDCRSYRWYHTPPNNQFDRRLLSTDEQNIYMEEKGLYSCRKKCNDGYSRFSETHKNEHPFGGSNTSLPGVVIVLVVLGLAVLLLSAMLFVCKKKMGGNAQVTERDKGRKTGGDYEQLAMGDKAVYHTLGKDAGQDKAEGEYEALKAKTEEGVYHTLGAGEGQSQAGAQNVKDDGGYEALQKKKEEGVYHTLGTGEDKAQAEAQGGYEALKNVKAEVYQTLSSAESEKPEGGYEQLPQKAKDYETIEVEDNPYEELKAQKSKEKE